ncbi:MAG: substrate-binding domain-containing protein [Gammaproteobacteria bacterium]
MKRIQVVLLFLLVAFTLAAPAQERLRLATTTSTENSGLLTVLNPPFEKQYGIKVDVIAVGTGKALRLARNGDVDMVLVHAPEAELKFVNEGYGIDRQPVMHNDFVLLGPPSDPAGVRQADVPSTAMEKIAGSTAGFISRGDDSGTHKKELALWAAAGIEPGGGWYLAAGQGMGAALKISDDKQAYTLADRGTYLAYKDKIDLVVVFQGAEELFNPYHIILVNPGKHPHVKHERAQHYSDFIRSDKGQAIIGGFRVSEEQLFHPDAVQHGE